MKKRLLAIVLVTLLIFQSFCIVQGQETEDVDFELKHAAFLKSLNIITDETDGSMVLTRGAAALYLTRMLNEEQSYYVYRGVFKDVPSSHEYALSIEKLADLGIIKGDGNLCFRPDDFLTYDEAVYLFAYVLGYGTIPGISSDAYKYIKQHKIMDGVLAELRYVNLSDFLIMVYNTLHSTALEQYIYGDNSAYKVSESTMLYKCFDILYADGVVIKNDLTYLWTAQDVEEDVIEIECKNDELLSVKMKEPTVVRDDLGKAVRLYYTKEKDSGLNIYIYHDIKASNRGMNITIGQIDINRSKINEKNIYYYPDKDSEGKNINLANDTCIIYNNMAYKSHDFDFTTIKNKAGNIEFISNNGDNVYEVVKFNVYDTIIAGSVAYNYDKIYDKYSSAKYVDIDEDKYTKVEIFDENGKQITLSDISAGDVVSVAKSDTYSGNNYLEIHVSKTKINGTVTKFDKDDFEPKLTLDSNFKYTLVDRAAMIKSFTLNKNMVALLDVFGNIVYITDDYGRDLQFGLVFKLGNDDEGLSKKLKLRMITMSGKVEEFEISDTVIIDGESYKERPDDAYAKLASASINMNGVVTVSQNLSLIRYGVNSEGKIKIIDTEKVGANNDKDLLSCVVSGTKTVRSNVIGWQIPYDADTGIIVLQSDSYSDADDYEDMTFTLGKAATYISGSGGQNVAVYKADPESEYADFIVKFEKTSMYHDDALFVIDEICEAYNEKEDIVYQISGYLSGIRKDIYMKKNGAYKSSSAGTVLTDELKDAVRGDIIRCKLGGNDFIVGFEKIVTKSASGYEYVASIGDTGIKLDDDSSTTFIAGFPYRRSENILFVNSIDTGLYPASTSINWGLATLYCVLIPEGTAVVVVDSKTNSVYTGSANDILDYTNFGAGCSKFVTRYRSGILMEFIIFN